MSKWLGPKQLVHDGTLGKSDMSHLGYLLTNFPNKNTLFSYSATLCSSKSFLNFIFFKCSTLLHKGLHVVNHVHAPQPITSFDYTIQTKRFQLWALMKFEISCFYCTPSSLPNLDQRIKLQKSYQLYDFYNTYYDSSMHKTNKEFGQLRQQYKECP